MQEEIMKSYRERLRPRLYDYLEAEKLLREPLAFECPLCGGTGRLADEETWYCPDCGNAGDLPELARLRWPETGEWERIRRLCGRLRIKITQLETFSSEELARMDLRPREYLVDGLLPAQGLTLLAAPPKSGKSWMVLQLAAALVSGESFLDQPTDRCRVLYISLEDNTLRLHERSQALGCLGSPDLFFCTRTELLGKGFEESVDAFLRSQEEVGLVIVDTLQKIREATRDSPSYGMDYSVMDRLKDLAERRKLSVLLVHHTNKKEDFEDAMNSVSGTSGIIGGVDGVWLLRRPRRLEGKALMQITGRDTPDRLLRLDFDRASCRWRFLGFEEGGAALGEPGEDREALLLERLEGLLAPGESWGGTATQLQQALGLEKVLSVNAMGKRLRELAPELEQRGLILDFRRDKGSRILLLDRRRSEPPESFFPLEEDEPLPEGW